MRLYLQKFTSILDIINKIIYISDYKEPPDLKFIKNGIYYPFPKAKFAVDSLLIKKF